MTLPVSGAISFNAINVELGVAGTTQANINQASYRTLAGVPSGTISLSNFYGKSNRVAASATISANTPNYVLNTAKASGYVAGKTDMTLTINSGVVVYSTSTGSYALQVDTSWTTGDTVTIVNSGTILGCGGNGGGGGFGGAGNTGAGGGPALLVQRATSINNVNRISGGGGGGGGGADVGSGKNSQPGYGGGGGGGIGGGAGGTANGGSGTLTSAGSGGSNFNGGVGGSGGTYGSSGGAGNAGPYGSGGGGGGGGACLAGNVNITWIAFGTRNGAIT